MATSVFSAPTGALFATVIRSSPKLDDEELNKIERDIHKVLYKTPWQQRTLEWLRDYVHPEIPALWRKAVLGRDFSMSVTGTLRARYHSTNWPEGVWSHFANTNLLIPSQRLSPVISTKKVTTAFRNDIVDNLITDTTAFGDYKFHEVGTGGDATEVNTDTALTTPSGIARQAGTQVENAVNIYESVATITADAAETWDEWGIFNIVTGGTMMDKDESFSIAVSISDQVQFTYDITFNAEA